MTATRSTPAPREVIAGRYRIEARLGRGGMGSVWRAQHLTLRSPVAIKLINPALASSEEALARFLREAQSAASLRSPHVVQILDHGVDAGLPYIVMELLEGESLADRLARTGKLSPVDTARIMTHVARAMARAHEAGVVHRDLKPDNVFLVRNDDEEIAKVLDFGVAKTSAKTFDVTTGTRTGTMLGTPYYMSPEQVEGDRSVDHRTDLWAMAVIVFECLVGVRPFESETLGGLILQVCSKPIPVPSRVGQVPPGFDEWFATGVERDAAKRFQSARELADGLRTVLTPGAGTEPVLPTPPHGTLMRAAMAATASANEGAAVSDIRRSQVPGLHRVKPLAWGAAGLLLLAVVAWLVGRAGPEEPAPGAEAPNLVRPAPVTPDEVRHAAELPPGTTGATPTTGNQVTAVPPTSPTPAAVARPSQGARTSGGEAASRRAKASARRPAGPSPAVPDARPIPAQPRPVPRPAPEEESDDLGF